MISADVVIEYKEGMTGNHFDVVGIDLMIIPAALRVCNNLI